MADDPTLRFYDDNAATYARRDRPRAKPQLTAFLAALPPRARILELGTGGGQDARVMLDRGFALTATDGSEGLAREATAFLGHPVMRLRFDELRAEKAYDGVWASAALLHVPAEELSGILRLVRRAMVPGAVFVASFKAGDGPGHDQFGRYYNYPSRERLLAIYDDAGPWRALHITERSGSGYDNLPTQWLWVTATI